MYRLIEDVTEEYYIEGLFSVGYSRIMKAKKGELNQLIASFDSKFNR